MPYELFFSYRRADFGAPMQEFFNDLAEEVRKLRGLDKHENLTFFDQESIETGDNWDATLFGALQQARVLVPLYSPAYFKSEYCGKEWQSFHLRRQAYAEQHGGLEPAVIKPVIWVPLRKENKLTLPENVCDAVRRVQYTWKDEESAINQQGLEQLVRLKTSNMLDYWNFVRDFATEIKDAIEQVDLPPMNPVRDLAGIPSAFGIAVSAGGGQEPAPVPARPGFRRHVRFIFAALPPMQLGAGRNPAPYQDVGGSDWKPFYPDLQRRIGALAAHIVSDAELDFDCDQVELTDDLVGAVRAAFKEGKPVVLFVDRWSLYASVEYQDVFREFDGQNFNNCALLLPWNPADPELVRNRESIDQVLADVLHFRSQYAPSSPYYCKDVASVDQLRQTLHAVLNQIQAEMRRNAPVRRSVGSGIARPVVVGPGGALP